MGSAGVGRRGRGPELWVPRRPEGWSPRPLCPLVSCPDRCAASGKLELRALACTAAPFSELARACQSRKLRLGAGLVLFLPFRRLWCSSPSTFRWAGVRESPVYQAEVPLLHCECLTACKLKGRDKGNFHSAALQMSLAFTHFCI